ncbi:NAD(P)-dependent oxidoreductase [Variovorax sp. EL159]|uniref:NAD(P)-dependent oxidoreductase n=1 Tax=Variovorax sp. EL159 TaxID=1566270 RepID=UPI0008824C26|nr:NAD(P)-dependent oxidoreductase [Variovorax sp. EL159]SCX72528.1 3-hydroxyisobutyrate dehydrogenase [Variovorax sp. EL159]
MAERIGWIGVGKMGLPMATHLVKAGHQVLAFDPVLENIAVLESRGAQRAISAKEIARTASVIFISVPDDQALRAVALGEEGLIAQAEPGTALVDTSTVSSAVSAEVGREATARGIGFIRATVSGNNHLAEAAMLTVLASGPRSDFERVLPFLRLFGPHQHYVGGDEQARTLKLAINLMVAGTATLMAEALTLGRLGGVEWNVMLDVLAGSAVGSPIVKSKAQQLKARDFSATFTARQLAKDLDLILQSGKALDAAMPLTALVAQMNGSVIENGMADEDYIAIVKVIELLSRHGVQAP